jgi:hypothetical protein
LSYISTLLAACLREEFLRFDAAPGDSTRLVKTRDELRNFIIDFLRDSTNQFATLRDSTARFSNWSNTASQPIPPHSEFVDGATHSGKWFFRDLRGIFHWLLSEPEGFDQAWAAASEPENSVGFRGCPHGPREDWTHLLGAVG